MKLIKFAGIAVTCMVLAGCGGSDSKIEELQAKNEQLSQRVKLLEDNLLDAQKQLIAHKQAMQTLNTRQREMENYFNKLQAGSSYTR